ncbi:hypothetical protein KKE78_02355 [Patescibacteria group bacterium]|nr:hypothetical protein [Patescibacteria group bacterium]
MVIQQSKKQSDLEKRLQLLRRQVYGKGLKNQKASTSVNQKITSSKTPTYQVADMPTHKSNGIQISSDLAYLNQDLLKILLFASCTIGAEIILFMLIRNNILTLNFF